jgi:thiol-disulfide isomerase/thioredoxin
MLVRAAALVAAALAGAGPGCGSASEPVPAGAIAVELALPTTAGTKFDPATLAGRPALVMFASPTCSYCASSLPIVQAAAAAEGVPALAVYIVGTAEAAAAAAARAGFTAPALVDERGALRRKYDITAVPYLVVLGGDGRARAAFRGEQREATLRAALARAR